MFRKTSPRNTDQRRGIAAVELAILLPILAFLFVVAVDFARIFYFSLTITNCARNGALYGCDPVSAQQSPYSSIQDASLADAGNLQPTPTVSSQNISDESGNQIEVTVSYTFKTITQFPGIPNSMNLTRSVRMRMIPRIPNFN